MTRHECTVDLAERQQRARYSSSEQLALDAHVAGCQACRAGQQLLSAFGEIDATDPQDGERIARFAAAARASVTPAPVALTPTLSAPKRARAPRFRALLLAAAFVSLVGSAAASAWHRHATRSQGGAPATDRAPAPTVAKTLASPPPMLGAPVVPTPALQPAPLSTPPSITSARSTGSVSAALLLRQAGDAQRRGARDEAAQLYQALQAQYPASAEALLSHVSLGRLLAERGQPKAALGEFDRYLAGSRGGVLIPEALYGRARSLTSLGDRAEESRTWQRLLRDFPDSAYAEPARRRLTELE